MPYPDEAVLQKRKGLLLNEADHDNQLTRIYTIRLMLLLVKIVPIHRFADGIALDDDVHPNN